MPVEPVNGISQQGFHFDSPNFQDSFNIALSWMVLHMSLLLWVILVIIFMLIWDIISAR